VFPKKAVLPERSFFVAADAVPSGARLPLILLLLVLLIGLIIFALPSLNAQVNTTTQSTTEGQCQNGGQSFNAQQEAYTLAQSAEHALRILSEATMGLALIRFATKMVPNSVSNRSRFAAATTLMTLFTQKIIPTANNQPTGGFNGNYHFFLLIEV
jgi:hypothetical protein